MLDKSVINKMRETIKKSASENSTYYKEVGGRDCYMHATKLDMNVQDIFPETKEFEVGSISDTFSNLRTKEEIEASLYSDMNVLGLNIKKLEDPTISLLSKYEWKIALYIMQEPIKLKSGALRKCCHLIRQDYGSKKWTHKSGYESSVTTVNFKWFKKHPKNAKLYAYYNGEKIYYDYVGTYKISLK